MVTREDGDRIKTERTSAGGALSKTLVDHKKTGRSCYPSGITGMMSQSSMGFLDFLQKIKYTRGFQVGFSSTAKVTYFCALRALDAAWIDVKLHQGPKMCQLTNQDLLGKVLRRVVRSGVLIQVAHFYILVTTTISTGCFPSWRYPHVLFAMATFVSAMPWMQKTATTVCCLRWMATLCGTRLQLDVEILGRSIWNDG